METKGRIKSFDAFRGIVILLVVSYGHYWQFTPAGYYADGTSLFFTELTNKVTQFSFSYTYSMMEFLFLLSGFKMFKYFELIKDNDLGFFDFMKKRFKRLYPLYFLSTIVMTIGLLIYLSIAGEPWYDRRAEGYHVIMNLLCIQTWNSDKSTINGPLWFVSVLVFCLILFYVISRIASKVKDGLWLMGIPVVIGILFTTSGQPWPLLNSSMCRGYIAFFLGVLVVSFAYKIKRRNANIYSCTAIVLYILYQIFGRTYIYEETPLLSRSLPALFMLYIPLILLVVRNPFLDKIIGNKVFCSLGVISYALYTLNFPFYLWLEIYNLFAGVDLPYGKTQMYWIMPVVQIGLAVLIYFFVEKPINKSLEKV
jgi:peptidoglycan/LPS O-acetylase OafA/YrhL